MGSVASSEKARPGAPPTWSPAALPVYIILFLEPTRPFQIPCLCPASQLLHTSVLSSALSEKNQSCTTDKAANQISVWNCCSGGETLG